MKIDPTVRSLTKNEGETKTSDKKKVSMERQEEKTTIILYESPHRLLKLLKELDEVFQENREVSISREISKIHEETISGTPQQLFKHFSQKKIKGEIVVVIRKE